jgi:hypothetical protein
MDNFHDAATQLEYFDVLFTLAIIPHVAAEMKALIILTRRSRFDARRRDRLS